jgi:hypothetical protein
MHVVEQHIQYKLITLFDNRLSLIHDECDVTVGHSISYIPDFEFVTQRSRHSITIEDDSPSQSQSDARVLKQRAIHFTVEFLVKTFSNPSQSGRVYSSCRANPPVAEV